MNILSYNTGKRITTRQLSKIAHDYFKRFRPNLGATFHKKIDSLAKEFMKNKKYLKKKIDEL